MRIKVTYNQTNFGSEVDIPKNIIVGIIATSKN